MESDLQSEYQVDLRDLWRPKSGLTIRRLMLFIKQLPSSSRFAKKMLGEDGILDTKEMILFEVMDLLARSAYFTEVSALSGMEKKHHKKVQNGAPKPIPRPGEQKKKKIHSTEEAIALLGRAVTIVSV